MDVLQMAVAEAGLEEEAVDEDDVNDVLAPAQAQAPGQAHAEVTTTYRGRPAVMKDGYTYIVKRTYKKTTYWRCLLVNKENCRAAAKSAEGSTVLTITNDHHTHDPDRVRMKVRQLIVTLKQQARDRTQTSAASIVDELMLGLEADVALAVNRQNLLRIGNRWKRANGSAQLTRPLASIEWPEAFTVTAGNPPELFLLYDSRLHEEGESVIFIFASAYQLQQLREHDHWSADGTFWCTPRLFEQLYTLHANIGTSSVAAAYILMQDRHETTYVRALRALVQHGGLQGVAPTTIMHDFELPAINAFKTVFEDSAIRLCLFHLAQAVWRNIGEHGLTRLYKENKKARELLRSFAALALVPPADVVRSLDLLVAEINRMLLAHEFPAEFDQGLLGFLEYFLKTYVHRLDRNGRLADARYKPALWNCYQAVLQGLHRTNNAVEGWHNEFNRTFPKAHMALDKFVQRLQMDESKNRQRLERHELYQAEPLRGHRRRRAYEEADKHILAIAQKYATHYLPSGQVLRYLRCMQFHLAQADYDERGRAAAADEHQAGAPADGNVPQEEAAAGEADSVDNIPLNESHPGLDTDDDGRDSDDDGMDFLDTPPGCASQDQPQEANMADNENVYDADVQRITAAELMPILPSQGGGYRLMFRIELRPAADCSCPEAISEYERHYYRCKLDAEWSPSKTSTAKASSTSYNKSEASSSRLDADSKATPSKAGHDEGSGSEYANDAHLNDFSSDDSIWPSLRDAEGRPGTDPEARAVIRREWAARDEDETFKTPTTEGSASSVSDDVSERTCEASVKSDALSDDSLLQELKAEGNPQVSPGNGPASRVGRRRKAARLLTFDEWAFAHKRDAPSGSGLQVKKNIFIRAPKASISQRRKKIKMENDDSSLPAMPAFPDGPFKNEKAVETADLTLDSDIFTVDSD